MPVIEVRAAEPSLAAKEQRIEPSPKVAAKLQALTPQSVADAAVVRDDDLEPVAVITTVEAFSSRGAFTDPVRADNFLRAFLNKMTGAVKYQLYQSITYNGDFRDFVGVNYATADGPISATLTTINHQIVTCYASLCTRQDVVAFEVPELVLSEVASQYAPGNSPYWRFRFKAQNGIDWEDRLMPAEAAGILMAVEQYRARHRSTAPGK